MNRTGNRGEQNRRRSQEWRRSIRNRRRRSRRSRPGSQALADAGRLVEADHCCAHAKGAARGTLGRADGRQSRDRLEPFRLLFSRRRPSHPAAFGRRLRGAPRILPISDICSEAGKFAAALGAPPGRRRPACAPRSRHHIAAMIEPSPFPSRFSPSIPTPLARARGSSAPNDAALLDDYSRVVSDVVDRVGPSVVRIDVRKKAAAPAPAPASSFPPTDSRSPTAMSCRARGRSPDDARRPRAPGARARRRSRHGSCAA